MAILVLVEAKARRDAVQPLTELLRRSIPETRDYDGCHDIRMYWHTEDGQTFVFVEHFESRAHYERYFRWREETGVLARILEMLDGPPSIRYFDPVDI